MNKERLRKLAQRLDKIPHEQFTMERYCGSACCIAGHAIMMREVDVSEESVFDTAQEWLEVDSKTAFRLFLPDHYSRAYDATNNQAASVIRHLIKTGKVEWEQFVS